MCVVLCCVVRVGKGKRRWKRIHELIGFQNDRINMDDLNQWDFQCETELDMIFQFFKCKVLGSELYVQCDSCEWCDQCNSIWFLWLPPPCELMWFWWILECSHDKQIIVLLIFYVMTIPISMWWLILSIHVSKMCFSCFGKCLYSSYTLMRLIPCFIRPPYYRNYPISFYACDEQDVDEMPRPNTFVYK